MIWKQTIVFLFFLSYLQTDTIAQQSYYSCQSIYDGFDDLYTHVEIRDYQLYINGYERPNGNILAGISPLFLGFNYNLGCINFTPQPWSLTNGVTVDIYLLDGFTVIDTIVLNHQMNLSSPFPFDAIGDSYVVDSQFICGDNYRLKFDLTVVDAGHSFFHTIATDPFSILDEVQQLTPFANSSGVDYVTQNFTWQSSSCTQYSNFFISEAANFTTNGWGCSTPPQNHLIWLTNLSGNSHTLNGVLAPNTTYIWGVHAIQGSNCAAMLDTFTTASCIIDSVEEFITACDSFTWSDGVTYYSSNNSAEYQLVNSGGCDSIISLNLTINNSVSGIDYRVECGPFTWIDGNTYSSSSNNAATHLIAGGAQTGCDSVVTLNLIIQTIDVGVSLNGIELISNALAPDAYQWLDCDNGFVSLFGQTDSNFIAQANGSFAVEISQNGCIDTSACYAVSSVVVESISDDSQFDIFPNPSDKEVYIQLKDESMDVKTIVLSDQYGRVVLQDYFSGGQYVLQEKLLPRGLYFVSVLSEESTSRIAIPFVITE